MYAIFRDLGLRRKYNLPPCFLDSLVISKIFLCRSLFLPLPLFQPPASDLKRLPAILFVTLVCSIFLMNPLTFACCNDSELFKKSTSPVVSKYAVCICTSLYTHMYFLKDQGLFTNPSNIYKFLKKNEYDSTIYSV